MARHVKSARSGGPTGLVCAGEGQADSGQARLIRLGRAANDNHAPRPRWIAWAVATSAATAAVALFWLLG